MKTASSFRQTGGPWVPRLAAGLLLASVLSLPGFGFQAQGGAPNAEPPGPVAAARQLATSGHRAEALELLDKRLAETPDSDARVLRGTILSWDGRYDEARRDLETVLVEHPGHGDAVPALINVEMWSSRPARAEKLAHEALRLHPNDPDLLLARAKALRAMNRDREALEVVGRLLEVDPGNQKAFEMKIGLGDSLRKFTASYGHSSEWFSDGRTPWREDQVQLNRETPMGSVIALFSHTDRFSLRSQQVQIDAYPHIRPGTYAYLNVGYSPDAALYPRYRVGADLYQKLGGGFEGSGGFRQLYFGGNVHIYTASLTKYRGNWMLTSRVFLTPDIAGTSHSLQFQLRRYLGGGTNYFGLRYGFGSSPVEVQSLTDTQILNSSSFAAEFHHTLSRRLGAAVQLGYSREDRLFIGGLRHYLVDALMSYRF